MKNFDLSVYFVADPSVCNGRAVEDVVYASLLGGARFIQYRDKIGGKNDVRVGALRVRDSIMRFERETGNRIAYVVNDYVDVAKEIGADGVHIGQGDISAEQAREILGHEAVVGLTAFTPEHMSAINPDIVDYVGTGPFYATKTDKGKPVMGADNFKRIAKISPVPVVGIGGITPVNAGDVMRAGADGVAVMRAISGADNPELATCALLKAVNEARG